MTTITVRSIIQTAHILLRNSAKSQIIPIVTLVAAVSKENKNETMNEIDEVNKH